MADSAIAEPKVKGRVAILVDGENVSQDLAGQIIMRSLALGQLVVRRVYGNATKMPKWDQAPGFKLMHSGSGKNATDMLLAIEAMGLSYEGKVDTLVIVSSDRDFTHLAHNLRERQMTVVGMGEEKTSEVFRKACTNFQLLSEKQHNTVNLVEKPKLPPTKVIPIMRQAMKKSTSIDGWCTIGWLGKSLRQSDAAFDPKDYGSPSLSDLVRKAGYFQIFQHETKGMLLREPEAGS